MEPPVGWELFLRIGFNFFFFGLGTDKGGTEEDSGTVAGRWIAWISRRRQALGLHVREMRKSVGQRWQLRLREIA